MKTGLVLEGGAMRGLFTAGVLDVMLEEGLNVDGLVGVSAGAAFGCSYKSRQIGRSLRYNLKYSKDKRYCSLYSLLRTGDLYGADFCYHQLPEKLDVFDNETFTNNPMEFYLVCTDVNTGEPVYHKCETADYTCMEWFRASASLPLVSRIVEVDGYQLLDGGISDSIPLKFFESLGYEKNIVVLTRPKDYRKSPNKMMPFFKPVLWKYPKLLDAMKRRHQMYNNAIDYIHSQKGNGKILVIQPETALPVKRIERDPDILQQVYDIGKEAAQKHLDEIKMFLA